MRPGATIYVQAMQLHIPMSIIPLFLVGGRSALQSISWDFTRAEHGRKACIQPIMDDELSLHIMIGKVRVWRNSRLQILPQKQQAFSDHGIPTHARS